MNLEAAWNTYIRLPLPWVRTLNGSYWARQQIGNNHGPEKYAKLQPESYVMLNTIVKLASRQLMLLEVGCMGGRHLRALRRRGYRYAYGLDVRPCLDRKVMVGLFEERLPKIVDRLYTVVFTFGMTVELVKPSFPICYHLARIANRAVVLVVQEHGVPYPRLYQQEFQREGFACTRYQTPITPSSGASLFVFERQP